MHEEGLKSLLRQMGCTVAKISPSGEIRTSCPLSKVTHAKGQDRHPSFFVNLEIGHVCYCQTCGFSGLLSSLLWKVQKLTGTDYRNVRTQLKVERMYDIVPLQKKLESAVWKEPTQVELGGILLSSDLAPKEPLQFLPEEHMDRMSVLSEEAKLYLYQERNLTAPIIEEWELGWCEGARRISIPIRDCKNRLVGISGRSIDPWKVPKFLHSPGFRRDFYLYGENKIKEGGIGYLVEGFFDVIGLWKKGYESPVAMFGSHLSKIQTEKLIRFFSQIVIVPDGDKPGYEAAERAVKALQGRIPVFVADVPMGKDPDDLTSDELIQLLGPPQKVK